MKQKKDTVKKDITNESYLQTVFRRFRRHRLAMVSLVVLIILVGAALLAPWIAPYDPDAIVGTFSGAPCLEHWLGHRSDRKRCAEPPAVCDADFPAGRRARHTDLDGDRCDPGADRRIFWRDCRYGHHAFYRIWSCRFRTFCWCWWRLPIFRPGLWNIILILGFVDWPGIARLVRGNVLNLRETNFVKGSIVSGMQVRHILFSEILPNTVAPILVYATSVLALSMLDEAALSFLGQGVQPPTASLGNMLNGAQSLTVLTKQPWLWIPAGLLIVILVMSINFIGDALRDGARSQQPLEDIFCIFYIF